MNASGVESLLRGFRRSWTATQALRGLVLMSFVAALFWTLFSPDGGGRPMLAVLMLAALGMWIGTFARSVWLVREMQASNWLMAYGRLDDAEARLGRTLAKFSLSPRTQAALFQQLAGLLFRRDRHREVVAICRELLRHRLGQFRGLMFNTRVLLADSLLLLDHVEEAYAAIRPVYNTPLSLADRMKLLPVQLRYELAAGHAGSAVTALADKVQVAELLESPRAALVHALLAEACRRQAMPVQQAYLAERARLYHDLAPLAERYPLIKPVAPSAVDEVERPGPSGIEN